MKVLAFPLLLAVLLVSPAFGQSTSSSASYSLIHDSPGGGGGQVSGGSVTAEISISQFNTGVSNETPSGIVDKGGYTGQLFDATAMILSADPSPSVEAGSSISLTGSIELDDGTSLHTGKLNWRILDGPFSDLDDSGIFTAGFPIANAITEIEGTFDSQVETIALTTNPAPVRPYTIALDKLGGSGGPYRILFGDSMTSLEEHTVGGTEFSPGNLMPGETYFWQAFDRNDSNITPGNNGPIRLLAGVDLEFVQIGDPGNSPNSNGIGSVADSFWVGSFEITNRQYCDFLNAVAGSDPFALFDTMMETDPRGGILRVGAPGDYTYTPKERMAEKPVNFVSFWSVCRYSNWLHNGIPSGTQDEFTTETGAYDMTDSAAIATNSLSRKNAAVYFIPDQDEWDKAAFFDPRSAADGGPADDSHYWLYPTVSHAPPLPATADAEGDIDNDADPIANYDGSASWNSLVGNVTTVGSGGIGSTSFYGCYDLAGNVDEWLQESEGINRAVRGGHYLSPSEALRSSASLLSRLMPAESLLATLGFRVAAPVDKVPPPPPVSSPSAVTQALKASLSNKIKKLKKKFKKAKKSKKKSKAKKLKATMKKLQRRLRIL